jgi:hypothetical protein
MKLFFIKNKSNIILGLISLALFLVPFFWVNTIGGDDGRFYYLFPLQFFKNFSLENISFADLGFFNPQQYMIPFSILIFIFKQIFFFLNTQKLFFGLNLFCGFLFFYLFLDLFDKGKNIAAKITASLFYSLSIFSYYTVWNSLLSAVYLVSIFPMVLYLFFRSVKESKIIYLILGSLVLSLFSIVVLSVPWFMALIIAALPLIIYLFLNHKKTFIKYFLIFIVFFILLNVYWLIGFILSSSSGGNTATVLSNNFRNQNVGLIETVSYHNSVLYPLFNLYQKTIQIDFNFPQKNLYFSYLLKLLPLNFLFLLVVIVPIFFYKKLNKDDKTIYNSALLSWLIILFLDTANIGTWGLPLFVWLNNYIPGFVMFRNMYDKFGIAMTFSYAFLLFISLKIIFNNFKIKKISKNIISLVLILLITLNGYPLLFGKFFELPIGTTQNTYPRINDFNDDFYSLTNYISHLDTSSRFLWLPLNAGGYDIISDKYNKNYYYTGISLLKTLSDKNDLSGTLSFDNFLDDIKKYILQKDYRKLFNLLGEFNIKYIILNKDINKELQDSYLYASISTADLYADQMNPDFLNGILGEKVADFGDRYSLYKISDKYSSETLNLDSVATVAATTTDHIISAVLSIPTSTPVASIEFQKIDNNQYEIYIKNLAISSSLSFLSYYNKFWGLYLQPNPVDSWCHPLEISDLNNTECENNQQFFEGSEFSYLSKRPIFDDTHYLVDDYANGWTIDPNYIKKNFDKSYYKENPDGSINVELTLYFKPQSYFYLGSIVSVGTLLACFGYLGFLFFRRKKKSGVEAII